MIEPVCAVVGVGPGNGAAFVRRFVSAGQRVAMLTRSEDTLRALEKEVSGSLGFACDVTDTDRVTHALEEVRDALGPVQTMVYNAGAGQFANLDNATLATFQQAWEVNARGLFVAAKAVVPQMRDLGGGNLVVIGATASLRGGANTAPFASAKAAQRSLAQSMARHLGPEKIHVSYVVVDGVIDLSRTRELMPDKPNAFFLSPDQIAESVYFLTRQEPQAWTFELDLRPFGERW